MSENNEFYAVFCTMRLDFNDLLSLILIEIELLYLTQNSMRHVPCASGYYTQVADTSGIILLFIEIFYKIITTNDKTL
jgi:hypothetical protein